MGNHDCVNTDDECLNIECTSTGILCFFMIKLLLLHYYKLEN